MERFKTLEAYMTLDEAIYEYQRGKMSDARAARSSGMGREAFWVVLRDRGIPVVDSDPAEIEDELRAIRNV